MICHGRRISLLICVLFLTAFTTACGSKNSSKWNSFPVPIFSDSQLEASPEMMADFETSMRFWESKAGKKLFDYQGVWSRGNPYAGNPANPSSLYANVIFFQNPWVFADNIAGRTTVVSGEDGIQASIIMINPAMPFCSGECEFQNYQASGRKNFTHELGHFLGMGHSDDIENIMYPELQPGGSLVEVHIDENEFRALVE